MNPNYNVRLFRNTSYKVHKQEETKAATTLVSKAHKQGALGTSAAVHLPKRDNFLHQWLHINLEYMPIDSRLQRTVQKKNCLVVRHAVQWCAKCPLLVRLAYQCSCCFSFFLFVYFVACISEQPYIYLITLLVVS